MKVTQHKNGVLISGIDDFDLEQTLDCGQCFRFWLNSDGDWHGVAGDRPITLRRLDDGILFLNITVGEFEEFWRRYFDLDRDYAAVRAGFPDHPALRDSTCFARGLRILRQDPWEALISFIISQNNNVPRIKGIIDRLCRGFGRPAGRFCLSAALCPCMSEHRGIRGDKVRLSCGIYPDAAKRVCSGQIDLNRLPPCRLSRLAPRCNHKGVGPKVAECVLLYGMGRLEAFPLDVWMKRAMAELFPGCTPESFGRFAGIAQQYIFHYCRCNPSCLCSTVQK